MALKHILAIGFKPGDIELSCGAVLAAHRAKGNLVTLLHLTDSDDTCYRNANRKLIQQLRIEAEDAAGIIHGVLHLIQSGSRYHTSQRETEEESITREHSVSVPVVLRFHYEDDKPVVSPESVTR